MEQIIARIKEMEQVFDEILAARELHPVSYFKDSNVLKQFRNLRAYYENGYWLEDYERDERGELPADLKRGILSQDAVYNLICEMEDLLANFK